MTWRFVSICNHAKLDFKMDYLEVRQKDTFQRIHLSEIDTLMFESKAVALTAYLIVELVKRKINVIFCDEYHYPIAQMQDIKGAYNSSYKLSLQINWPSNIKDLVWQQIIQWKILNQSYVLRYYGKEASASMLETYASEVIVGDKSRKESFAAKVYFNEILGENHYRHDGSVVDIKLNYGYSLLLSAISRAIASNGCVTQFGIWHKGSSNNVNLSCDFIEPFRPIVDLIVLNQNQDDFTDADKRELKQAFNQIFTFCNKQCYLSNIIADFTKAAIVTLNTEDLSQLKPFLL